MSVLVLAEHNNKELGPATLNAVAAALQIDDVVRVLVAGNGHESVVQEATKISGIDAVLVADAPMLENGLAENLAPLVVALSEEYEYVISPATTSGKNVMPRVAALLDVPQLSDVIAVKGDGCFDRPIYAGNIIATVKVRDNKKVITIRTTAFDPAEIGEETCEVKEVDLTEDAQISDFVGEELTKSDRPELGEANIIVSGGRGVGSSEDFQIIEALADKLGAAVGASRAAVDAGYVPNDYQVGQTGKVVAPQLYVAIGISGAIQHLAGMKDSKVIVAINKDEDAPIFQVADYGLVADLFNALPELESSL